MDETPKRKGRPPLPPELKKPKKKPERNYHKESGYAAQKKWSAANKEKKQAYDKKSREKYYKIETRIGKEYQETFNNLLIRAEMSITDLVLTALEEKYLVILKKKD